MKTSFSWKDLGLQLTYPKQTLISASIISAAGIALLIVAKLIFLRVAPHAFDEGAPFWNWNLSLYTWISYVPFSIAQEIVVRSMTYNSIRKMYDGKLGVLAAVTVSSLFFGGLHFGIGFFYVFGAIILFIPLNVIYEKHRNIWGVSIVHYVLGQAAECLAFWG